MSRWYVSVLSCLLGVLCLVGWGAAQPAPPRSLLNAEVVWLGYLVLGVPEPDKTSEIVVQAGLVTPPGIEVGIRGDGMVLWRYQPTATPRPTAVRWLGGSPIAGLAYAGPVMAVFPWIPTFQHRVMESHELGLEPAGQIVWRPRVANPAAPTAIQWLGFMVVGKAPKAPAIDTQLVTVPSYEWGMRTDNPGSGAMVWRWLTVRP